MILAPTLALNTPARGYDADASAFAAASGATDVAALSAFVKGVKELGLWNNMVCWPLRSAQNSGGADPTNSTVYSLGGLGAFNGARVGGPTWGANGVLANAPGQYVSFSSPIDLSAINAASIMAVMDFASFAGSSTFFSNAMAVRTDGFPPNTGGLKITVYADASSNNLDVGGTAIFPDGNELKRQYSRGVGEYIGTGSHFMTASIQANPNQVEFFYDGSSVGTTQDTTASTSFANLGSNNYFLGADGFGGAVATMTGSFYAVFNTYISSSNSEAIRSLYKATLGQGLALP